MIPGPFHRQPRPAKQSIGNCIIEIICISVTAFFIFDKLPKNNNEGPIIFTFLIMVPFGCILVYSLFRLFYLVFKKAEKEV
ncbi:hypothetical protein [Enterococcus sp. AZ109]|uniref:hypothetical protein n=1 Tax=Enterococcus sp. AZ109 TaxID=2774634 RepID=UPI003F22B88C